ncbi:Alpha-glucan water dikinase, chloroplastic [Gracilariopsis chorda]|uniref:Alpha-glucan water dikinase, chloroplastic n=1 Tax=Gracilariopsis chorda TaxID=448386 RepID=A0A2V3J6I9_9FLOR|nr:Alpha-glucan water dikinase, chloroplastic [Gracilariopsis chorda]|eukprot:PXF48990.1 Alpha-glucan water dikinase, chloroplastic [Gracilariopsis chorda]
MGASAASKAPEPTVPKHYSTETLEAHPLHATVTVTRHDSSPEIEVNFQRVGKPVQREGEPLYLHWGIVKNASDNRSVYVRPPKSMWPEGTDPRPGEPSLQSPFTDGGVLSMRFSERFAPAGLVFLFMIRSTNGFDEQWFKRPNGSSFYVDLTGAVSKTELKRRGMVLEEQKKAEEKRHKEEQQRKAKELAEAEARKKKEQAMKEKRSQQAAKYLDDSASADGWNLFKAHEEAYEFGSLFFQVVETAPFPDESASVTRDEMQLEERRIRVHVVSTLSVEGSDIVLHWGVKKGRKGGWHPAPSECRPEDSTAMPDGKAVQTVLKLQGDSGLRIACINNLEKIEDVTGLFSVIHAPNAPHHLQWMQAAKGGDIFIPVIPKRPLPGLNADGDFTDVCVTTLEGIIEREMEYGSWTLMHRYKHASHLISSVIGADETCWATIYVWMRYSQIRVLDWQRHFNTKPRELSSAQLGLVTLLANKFKNVSAIRWLARLVMSCVGRGGSGDLGQRIRDDILAIIRHCRDWGHGSMMEQWHQKLHNNTSPDDVVICDALIVFWEGNGNLSGYWDTIHSHGLSRERMASYEQPITNDPDFRGHIKDTMLWELRRYGALLRQVHLGTDLNSIVERCQGLMDDGCRHEVNNFMYIRNSRSPVLDKLMSVAGARKKVCDHVIFSNSLHDESRRDLIFLDLALESEARRVLESVGGVGHDGTLYSHLVAIQTAAGALMCSEAGLETEHELSRAMNDLDAVIARLGRQGESHDVGLRAAAGMNIMRNVLTEIIDRYGQRLGPVSKCLGLAFNADKNVISTFIEESVRGGPAFSLSTLLRKAGPAVRRVAQLGPYSTIAPLDKETKGPVVVFNKLRECEGANIKRGTVIIANECDGSEDVPKNASYVVIGSTVDVLSHVSVRARNERHGLIACLDESKLAELRGLHGCIVKAQLRGEDFRVEVVDDSARMSPSSGVQSVMKRVKSLGFITPPSGMMTPPGMFAGLKRGKLMKDEGGRLTRRELSERALRALSQKKAALHNRQLGAPWAIRPSEFSDELVGGKSLNLQRLVALGLPSWIKTPLSVAIPFGAMKKVMNFDTNQDLLEEYERLNKQVSAAKLGDVKICPKLRDVIKSLEAPEGLKEALRGVLDDLGCEDIDQTLPNAWVAVKGVWASIWNERAHLARQKLRLDVDDVDMAVLCQRVVDADYAFVIHTSNPVTGDENELYGEIVVGLGETLVGNAPGQAMGFTVRKDEDLDEVRPVIRSYPSKATALFGGDFIFRSDSNAEDLDGFAGAGLHDSLPLFENEVVSINYGNERLTTDDEFRDFMIRGVAKIGVEVEDIMGGVPQDIEGCFKDGEFYVVQARPQV